MVMQRVASITVTNKERVRRRRGNTKKRSKKVIHSKRCQRDCKYLTTTDYKEKAWK